MYFWDIFSFFPIGEDSFTEASVCKNYSGQLTGLQGGPVFVT